MIIGIGTDIVDVGRIANIHARYGLRFIRHILHEHERSRLPHDAAIWLSARFAAKEAAVKALGCGFSNGVTPTQIEIYRESSGKPGLRLHGMAQDRAERMGVEATHLSLSHELNYAIAFVVMEG